MNMQEFQRGVKRFMERCFTPEIENNMIERADRFGEEALETIQVIYAKAWANEVGRARAHKLVDYVFDRPVGELSQEVGGASVTLAALCLVARLDMGECAETELTRILRPDIMQKIRLKQESKRDKLGPLP